MFLPAGDEFLKAVITDLSLVEPLRVAGELMQGINCTVSLLGDLLPGFFECLRHVDELAKNSLERLKFAVHLSCCR